MDQKQALPRRRVRDPASQLAKDAQSAVQSLQSAVTEGLAQKASTTDVATAIDAVPVVNLQQQYDDLKQDFLCLLRWNIVTFGQIPAGLEHLTEQALGA